MTYCGTLPGSGAEAGIAGAQEVVVAGGAGIFGPTGVRVGDQGRGLGRVI